MLNVITVSGSRGCAAAAGGACGTGFTVWATTEDADSTRASSGGADLISPSFRRRQPLCSRDHTVAGRPERNRHFAEMDDVAVAEIDACADARAADERAVGALQIFDRGGAAANHEPGVPARDAGDVHPDPAAGIAAENCLAGRQHHGLVADDQPEAGV